MNFRKKLPNTIVSALWDADKKDPTFQEADMDSLSHVQLISCSAARCGRGVLNKLLCMYQELYFAGYINNCMSSYTACVCVASAKFQFHFEGYYWPGE